MQKSFLYSMVFLASLFAPVMAAEDQQMLVSYRVMTTELALKAAQAALTSCRSHGYQITVAIVDRGGSVQVLLRDRFAGPHTPDTAIAKAWTAVSFRTNTTDLVDSTQAGTAQSGIRHIPGVVMLGGGMVVESAGSMVGGIGVSGAPSGEADDSCASAGIEAISEELEF